METAASTKKDVCFILLPGFTPHNKLVAHTGETFARRGYDTIAANFWGSGPAPRFEDLTIDECVEGIKKVVDEAREKYTYVIGIGFSLGGALLLEYAKENDGLHAIVSAGTPFKLRWRPLIRTGFFLYPLFNLAWEYKKEKMDLPVPATKMIVGYLTNGFGKSLESIRTPTLLIHSKQDLLTSSRAMSEFFKRIGSAKKDLVYIYNASHVIEANGYIMYELLSKFLKSTGDPVQLDMADLKTEA